MSLNASKREIGRSFLIIVMHHQTQVQTLGGGRTICLFNATIALHLNSNHSCFDTFADIHMQSSYIAFRNLNL